MSETRLYENRSYVLLKRLLLWPGGKDVLGRQDRRFKFGMRNSELGMKRYRLVVLIPHSALQIPHFERFPPGPMKEPVPHHAEKHGLAPGPGTAFQQSTLVTFLESEGMDH